MRGLWVFAAVVVSLLAVTASAQAAFPGNNGKIVFIQMGANRGIYTVNPDGSNLMFIRPGAGNPDARPQWSPDGQRIVFTEFGHIHFINADGSGEVDTGISGQSAAWSPDGTQLVIIDGGAGDNADIFRINVDGTGRVNLTNTADTGEFSPVWSPDGTKIAFTTDRFSSNITDYDLVVMNADGTGRVNLTDTTSYFEREPDWSPDGQMLTYSGGPDSFGMGESGVHRMNADGSGITLLHGWEGPVWSPDGMRIAYGGPGNGAPIGIRSMAIDGTDDRIIANGGAAPDWQRVSGTGANVSVFKADAPDPAYVGEVLTYTLTVRNFTGPSTAENVVLTDNLPSSVTFLDATPSQGSCGLTGSQVTCALGDLPTGAIVTVEVRVQPTTAGTIVNSSSVTTSTSDPDSSNNQSSKSTTVAPVAGYARPKGATPLRAALVPAFAGCVNANRTHGPPLAYPSCASPAQVSPYVTVGTPDANGQAANSVGSVRLDVQVGNPATSEDEADVHIRFSLSDVYRKPGLADYQGQLDVQMRVRLTDRLNGNPAGFPATAEDWTWHAAVQCAATASTTTGGVCDLTTSADAITLGSVPESKRSIWQLGQVQVFDAGPSGFLAVEEPNFLFAVQGVFVP